MGSKPVESEFRKRRKGWSEMRERKKRGGGGCPNALGKITNTRWGSRKRTPERGQPKLRPRTADQRGKNAAAANGGMRKVY